MDWIFKQVCQLSALLVICLVLLIVLLLYLQARPALSSLGLRVLAGSVWRPDAIEVNGKIVAPEEFGGLAFVYGSVLTSLIGMLIAVPLGVGTAAFLSEIAGPRTKRVGSFLVELLAAIPSVVYGFWGMNVLAPFIQSFFTLAGGPNVSGRSILTAGVILSIMVVPYVAAISYDVCQAVPGAQRQGALALGATRWQTIWRVVLPYAQPGIIGGCFLALGRAIGETIAVTLLIGNATGLQSLPFGQGSTIPSILAQQLPNTSSDLHAAALLELALILFGVTILLNVCARLLIWRVGATQSGLGLFIRLFSAAPGPAVENKPQAETSASSTHPLAESHAEIPPRAPLPANPAAAVQNRIMTAVLALCLVITCGPLFLVLGYITAQGIGAINLDFFIQLPVPPGSKGGGLANGLVGSAIIVGLATLFALPIGLLAAIYLAEYRSSKLVPVVRFFGELLNGVPSIVVGTFVYALVALVIQAGFLTPRQQFSGWAGAGALAIMMIPIVMRASEEALKLVPEALRNASYALGAHHWQTVVRVTVPAALPAIITGTFLAIARIAGETAPLLLTIFGNNFSMVLNPGEKMPALPLFIYQYSQNPDPLFQEKAWAGALVLLSFVMLLNVGIRLLTGKRVVQASRAE